MLHPEECEDDEWKGGTVIEPRFTGKPVAHSVFVACIVDGDHTGKHRISRGEHGTKQEGRGPTKPQRKND